MLIFLFYKTTYLNEEVNRTEQSPSVRVPCFHKRLAILNSGCNTVVEHLPRNPKGKGLSLATTANTEAQRYETFLSIIYECSLWAWVFVLERPFQPCLMFASKAGA